MLAYLKYICSILILRVVKVGSFGMDLKVQHTFSRIVMEVQYIMSLS